ncbi:rRNA maturation RNase YbeY [bacterium]|nr:MAG: rRNA maturation RNase YbeY [bacterium]
MKKVEVTVKNIQKKIQINPREIKKLVLGTLLIEKNHKPGQVNVCFVDGRAIRKLNRKFHNTDSFTDVLSFDMGDRSGLMIELAISTEAAISYAKRMKTQARSELCLYVIHGILHVLGYDDRTPRQKLKMDKRQEYILRKLV